LKLPLIETIHAGEHQSSGRITVLGKEEYRFYCTDENKIVYHAFRERKHEMANE